MKEVKVLVSIIVAAYNVEKYLNQCLDSAVAQTLREIEIIVVNDGSTDNSGLLAESYSSKDNRVSVIHKENGGLASARNAGMKEARGEYLFFLDGDDWIEPTLVAENYGIAARNHADLVIFGHVKHVMTGSGVNTIYTTPPVLSIEGELETKLVEVFEAGCGFAVWEQLIRTEMVRKNRIEYPSLKRGADMAFLFLVYPQCESLTTNPKVYYHYNAFTSQTKFNPNLIEDHVMMFELFLNMFPDWMSLPRNHRFASKLFVLWFSHVVPSGIALNRKMSFPEKILSLRSMFANVKIDSWLNQYAIADLNTPVSKLLMLGLKLRNVYFLYAMTVLKWSLKKQLKANYKKWLYKK